MNSSRDTQHRILVASHYEKRWGVKGRDVGSVGGPLHELPRDFAVLEFLPYGDRKMWTYATCCMSQAEDNQGIELHLFSPEQSREPVEILVATAHYHRTGSWLGHGHTVNFGKPWMNRSRCEYGLISLPYLDGPEIENLRVPNGALIRCLWLVPVSKSEVEFKKRHGLNALEEKLEKSRFNYLDPFRLPVC